RFYSPQGQEDANNSRFPSEIPFDQPAKRQFRGLFSVALTVVSSTNLFVGWTARPKESLAGARLESVYSYGQASAG
ncbi:hypothetical protein, partial [Cupriavidus yeoncheonensis]|uniref:hypothetical protein n=1 Tax=Cupriavidus yeoncheonensis TaxID=1462994 RepID=UPI001BAC32A6